MKSRTFRAWTRWFVLGCIHACMIAYVFSVKVQASSNITGQSVNQEGNYNDILSKVAKVSVDYGMSLLKESKGIKITELAKEKENTAVLMFTGDLMCLGGQQNAAKTGQDFNFIPSFSYVKKILKSADLVVGNLETLISPSNPYTYQQKDKNGNPQCNAMPSYLDALLEAGFDAVVTANNHSLDHEEKGVIETIQNLEAKNIAHTGTYLEDSNQPILLFEVGGIRIALLSYTELINARNSLSKSQVEQLVSCYSKEKVIKDVKVAKKYGAEYIIAYNHWGTENTHDVTKQQRAHAQEMAEAGVDLILGSHPHCLQEVKYLTTKEGKTVLCVYSLGNFVSSMTREINNDTMILEVVLHKYEDIVYTGTVGYYPLKVSYVSSLGKQVIVPMREDLNDNYKNKKQLLLAKERIEAVIGSEITSIR